MILVSVLIFTAIIVGHDCLVAYLNDTNVDNHFRYKRMSGGSEVVSDKFPFIVHIRTKIPSTKINKGPCYEKLCTGTLIHPKLVLTHFNCLMPVKTYVTRWFKVSQIRTKNIKVNNITFLSLNIIILLLIC